MNKKTILLLSTPCFDSRVGAAKNHIIDDKIMEFEYSEFKNLLQKYFIIEDVFGTFASQKDYKTHIVGTPYEKIFNRLHQYYDSNILSVFFAPLFPQYSRNCLWRLKWMGAEAKL